MLNETVSCGPCVSSLKEDNLIHLNNLRGRPTFLCHVFFLLELKNKQRSMNTGISGRYASVYIIEEFNRFSDPNFNLLSVENIC